MSRKLRVAGAILGGALAMSGCGQNAPGPAQARPSSPASPKAVVKPAASAFVITTGGVIRQFSAPELLARSDVAFITIPNDVAYGRTMSYRAVPLRALLSPDTADTLEVRATDGFVAQLPRALIDGASMPWVAIEQASSPWPNLQGKTSSAGPFYLVWTDPEKGGISQEQWPYAMAAITAVASPAQRWPEIAVDASVAAGALARRGQAVFIANCLSCHRLAGDGEGSVGPDLLKPMPAAAYFSDAGLRALIRNPASVRTWPDQKMPAFDAATIPDADIGAVIAYLSYLAKRR